MTWPADLSYSVQPSPLNDCQGCGAAALERVSAKGVWVTCSGCCRSTERFKTFAEAIEAWNLENRD